jgi:L-histidine Nalpha-methyltransferase
LKKEIFFELIELGAGDGTKTKELLNYLISNGFQFDYRPLDISQNALNGLKSALNEEIPALSVQLLCGDYFEVLTSLKSSKHPKVVLFLGSNIGNMLDARATEFMKQLSESLSLNDAVFLGVDVIKSREIVLPAYNDAQGITAAFNLNLLRRINRELGGNFDVESFEHCPEYTEEEGIAKSALRSKKEQVVHIQALNQDFHFAEGEQIHTEVSRKYNDAVLSEILAQSQFRMAGKLVDSKNYFADYVLVKE